MRRIDRILDLIQAGEYDAEIIRTRIKTEDHARGEAGNRLGRESEANARRILGQQLYIKEARPHTPGASGRDLKIIFENWTELLPIFVEVKSSLGGVEDFLHGQVYAKMRRNQVKVIVLNANADRLDEDILADFERQLRTIAPTFRWSRDQ